MANQKTDLKKFKKVSPERVDQDAVKTMVSIRLNNSMIAGLKDEADRLGIPYQTLISSILHRYLNREFIDREEFAEFFKEIKNFG